MKNIIAGIVGVIGFFGLMIIIGAVLGFYAFAFSDGAAEWFGWESWWTGILFIAIAFFFRGIGLFAGMIVGGYGAYYVWDWPLWAVVIVFFPGFAFMVGGAIATLVGGVIEKFAGRSSG